MRRNLYTGLVAVALFVSVMVGAATAQQQQQQQQQGAQKPPLSPPATAETSINGRKITINYSAPSMRSRKIMGELVPYGKVWRTGANKATTLTTDADLTIGTLSLPKGTYSLFTVPGETAWKLIINKQTGQSGTQYNEGEDVGRVDMDVKKLSAPVEKFTISLSPTTGNNGVLRMAWENTEVSVPISVR